MLLIHEDVVKEVLLEDTAYKEMLLELQSAKNKDFQGRIEYLKRLCAKGRATHAEVAYVELVARWVTHVYHLLSEYLEVCFKKSPSLKNK